MDAQLWPMLGIPFLIFLARLADVTLGTVRIIFVARGMRYLAPAVGFLESLIWVTALAAVMQHLDQPQNYVFYAAGFATGNFTGILVEERLGIGLLTLRIITRDDAVGLTGELRREGFGVTSFAAEGVEGYVQLLFTVLQRKDLNRAIEVVRREHPRAFVSVSDVRYAKEGFITPRRPLFPFAPRMPEAARKAK